MEGVIKSLKTDKGFGFIRDGRGTEYFFHFSAAPEWSGLREGQRVTFEQEESPKGPRAGNVRSI